MANCIILNKIFDGGWLDKEGRIGHEVIDFVLADNRNYYVYNNPWGSCPDDIGFNETKKYNVKYLLLTSAAHNQEFDILYVIELENKMHDEHRPKASKENFDFDSLRKRQEKVEKKMQHEGITYNGEYLDQIYQNDDSLYLTFKAKTIYKADKPIHVRNLKYNFQRNKGYIHENDEIDGELTGDYSKVIDIIKDEFTSGNLSEFQLQTLKDWKSSNEVSANKCNTFLTLIGKEDNEQVYTNMLYSILSQGDMMNRFCREYGKKALETPVAYDEKFSVMRETKVVDGRMDICAESQSRRVVIENKVYSGLNGVRPEDNSSQLKTYYEQWITKDTWVNKKQDSLCFITLPDYREKEIEDEIEQYDLSMSKEYNIVTYGQIAKFINDNKDAIPQTYEYYFLLAQIIAAFQKLSYNKKEDLYLDMFYQATLQCKPEL